jgi:phage terminase large subunit-like protein
MSEGNTMVHMKVAREEDTHWIISFEINPLLSLSNDFTRAR